MKWDYDSELQIHSFSIPSQMGNLRLAVSKEPKAWMVLILLDGHIKEPPTYYKTLKEGKAYCREWLKCEKRIQEAALEWI